MKRLALLLFVACGPEPHYTAEECVALRAAPTRNEICPDGARDLGSWIHSDTADKLGRCCAPISLPTTRAPAPPRPR